MLEFFEFDVINGSASIYESHITLNKTLLKYFADAYRVRVGIEKEEKQVYIYLISKDYAMSGELNTTSLLPVSVSKTYARICSRPLIDYICKNFGIKIDKNSFKRYQACYDAAKKVIIINIKEEIC